MDTIFSTDDLPLPSFGESATEPHFMAGFIYTGPQNPCVWLPHAKSNDPSLGLMARALLDAAQDGARYYCATAKGALLFCKESAHTWKRIAP